MKNKLFTLCFLISICSIQAQNVGINNTASQPDASAMLDVKSSNKGLLIPRVALNATTDNTTIPAAATSLLIYNTASSGAGPTAVSPGFYYWNNSGNFWIRLITDGSNLSSGWLLGGNAATNPSSHFIGTTDNNSLLFKVNNQKAGYVGVGTNDGNVFWGYLSGINNIGFSNVGIGIKSLFNNSSSSNLVAIGDSALFSNTLGSANTSAGSKSLFSNTVGGNNTAIGSSALYANTTGINNTSVGANSLISNTTGANNVANGVFTLISNTTGSANTVSGNGSLYFNTTGNNNTVSGFNGMLFNTNGNNNTAYGFEALYSNSTGHSNVGIGVMALYNNSVQSNLVAIGDSALFNNTTGSYNTAIGSKSLFTNSTGSGNVAQGSQALYSNTTGTENTASGDQALYHNIDGSSNTANGFNALYSNISGNNNTANGSVALSKNTSGSENTAYGAYALFSNTTGNKNTANGILALYDNTSGIQNTAYGASALISNTTGNNNTANGDLALAGNVTGNSNSAFGYKATIVNFSNATAIGALAQVNCSNCLVLGSVNGVNGALSSVNVGIGMNNPSNRLHIFNGASGISPFAAFQTPLVVENNDHTYINLLSPEDKETALLFGKPSNASSGALIYNNTSTLNGFQFRTNGNVTRMVIDNTGNVGVGTIVPFAYGHGGDNKITEISNPNAGSDIQSHLILSTNGTAGSTGGITWASQNVPGIEKRLAFIGDVYETSNAARMVFYTRNNLGGLGERLTILGNGNVGIGAVNPGFLLEVNGAAAKVGGGSWSVTSDARMKENVIPYTDGLSILSKINPVKFHYNQLSGYDTKPEYVGVLAQELQSIAPYMVGSFQKEGETYYTVDNSAMTYMLINAVKEQQHMIHKQQQQIDDLKKIVEQLLKK